MATSGNDRPEQRLGTALSDRGLIAQAGFQGRAYIFLRRWGANGLGHVGWGYRTSSTQYDCGSMENNSGNPTRFWYENNDAWYVLSTSNDTMNNVMQRGVGPVDRATVHYGGDRNYPAGDYLVRPDPASVSKIKIVKDLPDYRTPSGHRSPGRLVRAHRVTEEVEFRRYTERAWLDVASVNVEEARKIARHSPFLGYNVDGNNCADLTYKIVAAYGVPAASLSWLQTHPGPSAWFDGCVEQGWHRDIWPALPD